MGAHGDSRPKPQHADGMSRGLLCYQHRQQRLGLVEPRRVGLCRLAISDIVDHVRREAAQFVPFALTRLSDDQ